MARVPGFRYGTVISNRDSKNLGKILVCIGGNQYVEAFPLLPKMFYVKPKEKEGVFVFFADATNPTGPAGYLGPIISQEHKLYFEEGALNPAQEAHVNRADVAPDTYPKDHVDKLSPDNAEEIVVRGRKSSEMHFADDFATISAGVRKICNNNQYNMIFNEKNPAFAKFKYHYKPLEGNIESTATIVADRINLLSTNTKGGEIKLSNNNELISDYEIEKALKEAYRLPYGEKLVELLNVIIDTLLTHTHPFPMEPPILPSGAEIITKKAEYLGPSPGLLSEGIRIN